MAMVGAIRCISNDPTESVDTDGDGRITDVFPMTQQNGGYRWRCVEITRCFQMTESVDTDGDGVGDNSDVFP